MIFCKDGKALKTISMPKVNGKRKINKRDLKKIKDLFKSSFLTSDNLQNLEDKYFKRQEIGKPTQRMPANKAIVIAAAANNPIAHNIFDPL